MYNIFLFLYQKLKTNLYSDILVNKTIENAKNIIKKDSIIEGIKIFNTNNIILSVNISELLCLNLSYYF